MTPLSEDERKELRTANDKVTKLRRDEESKWAQRVKVKHIQQGGNNTKYFHLIANDKHRKKKILQLEQEEGTIMGEENLKVYISEYYKKQFGKPTSSSFNLLEEMNHDIPQVSTIENDNEILTKVFCEQESFGCHFLDGTQQCIWTRCVSCGILSNFLGCD
jgi:hypothetical protein